MSATQKDIARLLGMAQSTVSMALSGSPRLAEETRHRVRSAAERLGYHPHFSATSLSARRTNTISVMVHGLEHIEVHSRWLVQLQRAAHARKLKFRLDDLLDLEMVAGEHSADGFVIFGERLGAVEASGLPVVYTDCAVGRYPHNSVATNNLLGGDIAVRHLAELGHTRIAFFGLLRASPVCEDRFRGYLGRMGELGLPVSAPDVIEFGHWDVGEIEGHVGELLQAVRSGVTGIIGSRDAEAAVAIRYLRAQGLSVPGDVAVIGFDNTRLSQLWDPPITVMDQDTEAASDEAMSMMQRLLVGGGPQESVTVGVRLIRRESTGLGPADEGK